MPLDASLFLQAAQLRAQQNAALQQNLQNAANTYVQGQQQDKDNAFKQQQLDIMGQEAKAKSILDIDKIGPTLYAAKLGGQQLTPEQDATLNAWGNIRNSEMTQNPVTGLTYSKNGALPGLNVGRMTTNPSPMPTAKPYMQPMGQDISPITIPDRPPVSVDFPDGSAAQVPPVSRETLNIKGLASPPALPMPANPVQANDTFKTQNDIAAAGAKARAEAMAKLDADQISLGLTDKKTLPIIDAMLRINEGTPDIPYADTGIGRAVLRTVGNKEKSTNLDLLRQNRLDLAAPLAKQLGVNPTDKDFQSTLDRIVDLNSTKESRTSQLNNLKAKILARQNGGPVGQAVQEGQTATGPKGEKIIFKGGQWQNL